MSAIMLDGAALARRVREELKGRVALLRAEYNVDPTLAAVLVGGHGPSEAYVGMKEKACTWVGMSSRLCRLDASASQAQIEDLVAGLSADPSIHGILVQHPMPQGIDEMRVLSMVAPEKDVDGISRSSLGSLITGEQAFVSCTPLGIIELLRAYQVPMVGARAVVLGRSVILGKPVALLLVNENATVTVCHSRTRDLAAITREADILVAAVGRPEMVTGDMVKPGAVVIDAGYNRIEGRGGDVGDVHFDSVKEVASHLTPVPGGVGPMTIAMLLRNTCDAVEMSLRGA